MTLWPNINIIAETIEQVYCSMGDVGVLNVTAFRFSPHDAMYIARTMLSQYISVSDHPTRFGIVPKRLNITQKFSYWPVDPTC